MAAYPGHANAISENLPLKEQLLGIVQKYQSHDSQRLLASKIFEFHRDSRGESYRLTDRRRPLCKGPPNRSPIEGSENLVPDN